MALPTDLNPHWLAGGEVTPVGAISRSLRFNRDDSTYLSRTPGSNGNLKTWTFSFWWKPCDIGASSPKIIQAGTSGHVYCNFQSDGTIYFDLNTTGGGARQTTQVFRDFSAWYHIVFAVDTTQATANDRAKIYVNGTQVTSFATLTNPNQNVDTTWNSTVEHNIGRRIDSPTNSYPNMYLTEVYNIDGQQLTPSSFGETDTATGVWKPKAYSGSYGTNGFYLKFADNSGTTSTTLGKDSSGNGNNWTPNNFSVTAGAGNDSLVDTPTPYGTDTGAGGTVRGNYATLNPLESDTITLSNGNLQGFGGSGGTGEVFSTSTIGMSSGKWYCEVLYSAKGSASALNLGIIEAATLRTTTQTYPDYGYYSNNGNKYNDLTSSSYGASWDVNDVIGISYDADAGTLVFYKNGVSQGTAFSGLSGTYFFCQARFGADSHTTQWNFGQRPFAYAAPSGFKALCTQNLPTPTIGATSTTQAKYYFDIITWTDSSTGNKVLTPDFSPDMLWSKSRSNTTDHAISDRVRGNFQLFPNQTYAEDATQRVTWGTGNVTLNDGYGVVNETGASGYTYVDWLWKANGAGSINNAGSIQSTVSASTTAGFSIVTWTADGSNSNGVGHGLGVTPTFMIYKKRSPNDGVALAWYVWTTIIDGSNDELVLNTTAAKGDISAGYGSPTSTTISNYGFPNGNSLVAYCFAPVAGYSAFGSYTGNASTNGPFIFTGFRPRWIMIKRTSISGESWFIHDTARSPYNVSNLFLLANLNWADTTAAQFDILSNGIKIRETGSGTNSNGETYIYAAFAESPFKYALAR